MSILITTTSNFENTSILKYYSPITANVVVGTNVFGDLSASISDLFGGRSEGYEKRLKTIYLQALSNIELQALKIGGNGIVGLKIDYNEISGKGMQMFMVSVTGTPVKINLNGNTDNHSESQSIINGELIELKIKAKRLLKKIKGVSISKVSSEDLTNISNSSLPDYLEVVNDWLNELKFQSNQIDDKNQIDWITKYLENIPLHYFKNCVYKHLFAFESNNIIPITKLVEKRDALDFKEILMHLSNSGGSSVALLLLVLKKSFYDRNDLESLQAIYNKYDSFYPLIAQEREEINKGLFSNELIKVWDCSCGKKVTGNRCSNCDKDGYGYSSKVPNVLGVKNYIADKIEILEVLLKLI